MLACLLMEAGLEEDEGGGRNLNNPYYANDTNLIAEDMNDLPTLVIKVKKHNGRMGLGLNLKKSKLITTGIATSLRTDNEEMVLDCFGLLLQSININ